MSDQEPAKDLNEEVVEQPSEENVVSIFKNLTQERFKSKPKIELTTFDDIEQKNRDTSKKIEEERKKKNNKVLRSYRIK